MKIDYTLINCWLHKNVVAMSTRVDLHDRVQKRVFVVVMQGKAATDLSVCNGVIDNFNLLPSRGTIPSTYFTECRIFIYT